MGEVISAYEVADYISHNRDRRSKSYREAILIVLRCLFVKIILIIPDDG
jgi:hypothetical protein